MTPDRPTGAELLEIALEVLRGELLDELSGDKRYAALMVASAMEHAWRELAGAAALEAAAVDRLSDFLGAPPGEGLAALDRRLVEAIRAGRFDGPGAAALHDLLLDRARDRVRLTNPRYLERREAEENG